MIRVSDVLLRRGKPHVAPPPRYWLVPRSQRPFQGGQQHFQHLLLQRASAEVQTSSATNQEATAAPFLRSTDMVRLPESTSTASIEASEFAPDPITSKRAFNERDMYDQFHAEKDRALVKSDEVTGTSEARVAGDGAFQQRFGYSLLKRQTDLETSLTRTTSLDLWAEQPRYRPSTYFLYLVARRRNAYAVIFDAAGKRVHPTYSVGNRGLKKTDKGFKAEGSAENAHQITGQYLTDALPSIRELEAAAGRPIEKGRRIELVVRLIGFYNGRQGAIRAVTDRSDAFEVKYVEDVTPFPLNGPRMPKNYMS